MPRIAIRKAAKAVAKKSSKKVVKKVAKKVTRKTAKAKADVSAPDNEKSFQETPEQLNGCSDTPARDFYAEAGSVNSFGTLIMQASNPVVAARAHVIHAVQHMISAAIDSFAARNEEEPVRAYVRSVQESAAREFDMALHLLESEIRR